MNTSKQQKIIPYLWYEGQAEEAANFYVSVFSAAGNQAGTGVSSTARYGKALAEAAGRPEGSVLTVNFQLAGQQFVALNGGPEFKFTPSTSFFVNCDSEAEVDLLWGQLSAGGEVLMPLDAYPFSSKFGWANDRYGLSWQLSLSPARPKIVPFLMFVGDQHGNAEAAIGLYTSLFEDSGVRHLLPYGPESGGMAGTLMQGAFTLAGQDFIAMDGGLGHAFTFTEAVSFQVACEDQDEVDRLWEQLRAGGEEQPCGWLVDRFGVAWQVVPIELMDLLASEDAVKAEKATAAMLQMKKIEIEMLRRTVTHA